MNKLITLTKENALEVFTGEKLEDFLKDIEDKVINFVPDTSTDKGRKIIASNAHLVAKEKIKIDDIGKELVMNWKQKAKLVDISRKKARDFLDDLKIKVRLPLTNWETEETKQKEIEAINKLHEEALKEDELFNRQKEIERREAEFEAAEEAKLEVEREKQEEKQRLEREKQIALTAKQEAELKAERDKIEAEAKRRKEIEDAKIQAEMEKQAAIEKEKSIARENELKRLQQEKELKETAKRKAANLQHQKKINNEALKDFQSQGFQAKEAKEIILLIAQYKIKNITINY